MVQLRFFLTFLYLIGKVFLLMNIAFKTKKISKIFNTKSELHKKYGNKNAEIIMMRMDFLKAAPTLQDVPHQKPYRWHELKGSRRGQFTVDLKQPTRLVFKPNHDPLPKREDGGLDLSKIASILILSVEDIH